MAADSPAGSVDEADVLLPQWGMGMQDGTVLRWLKSVGDEVTAGEPLADIEAAKAEEVLESPVAGTLARILAGEGETVPVGAVLATIRMRNSA